MLCGLLCSSKGKIYTIEFKVRLFFTQTHSSDFVAVTIVEIYVLMVTIFAFLNLPLNIAMEMLASLFEKKSYYSA